MIPELGQFALILALLIAAVQCALPIYGAARGNTALIALARPAVAGQAVFVALAFGILISARTSSQRIAMMGVFLTTLLPNILLSGFIFPLESMPAVLQWLSFVIPGRWFVAIARGIMLKGIGLEYLWRETLYIAGLATVLLVASIRSFHERLE